MKKVSVLKLLLLFQGQVLANLKAMDSVTFAKEHMGRSEKVSSGAYPATICLFVFSISWFKIPLNKENFNDCNLQIVHINVNN